jgi:hypothetical protein
LKRWRLLTTLNVIQEFNKKWLSDKVCSRTLYIRYTDKWNIFIWTLFWQLPVSATVQVARHFCTSCTFQKCPWMTFVQRNVYVQSSISNEIGINLILEKNIEIANCDLIYVLWVTLKFQKWPCKPWFTSPCTIGYINFWGLFTRSQRSRLFTCARFLLWRTLPFWSEHTRTIVSACSVEQASDERFRRYMYELFWNFLGSIIHNTCIIEIQCVVE